MALNATSNDPSRPLRVIFTVYGYKPAYRNGGPIYSVSALAEGLVRAGHDVNVLTTNCNLDRVLDVPLSQAITINGVTVWYFPRMQFLPNSFPGAGYFSRSIGYLYCPQMALELSRQLPAADLVHSHLPFVYPTYIAAKSAKRLSRPHFYHQRGVLDPERLQFRGLKKQLYLKFFERPILRDATTLIALTDAEVASYRAQHVTSPIATIPNGVDPELFQTQCDPSWEEQENIDPTSVVILFLGRLHPVKGADQALEAFQLISKGHPNAVIFFAGPDEFGLEQKLSQQALDAGLANRIRFCGMVEGRTKTNLLARADLFCLPSLAEGFSISVLEALASETAVLLSPGCHFAEVEVAGAGKVVTRNALALSVAFDEMLRKGRDGLRQMGRRGRELVMTRYSWDTIVTAMIDTYRDGIERYAHQRTCRGQR